MAKETNLQHRHNTWWLTECTTCNYISMHTDNAQAKCLNYVQYCCDINKAGVLWHLHLDQSHTCKYMRQFY